MCSSGLLQPLGSWVRVTREASRWCSGHALWSLVLFVCWLHARAENFKAPDPGPGAVPITGTWQFHTGDDLAWANPAYNDSGWQPITADQPWGAQGHPGYTGYVWYRKRLDIGAGDKPLGIFIPESDGAYEVYWNGQRIGNSGSLPLHVIWYANGQNAALPLSSSGARTGVLASLPLGLAPDAEYDEVRTQLAEGETMTVITDGVLEARNGEGELYGFERVAELMRERPSAEQVAEAACTFGQEDDITVLSVTREVVREPLPANGRYQFSPAV